MFFESGRVISVLFCDSAGPGFFVRQWREFFAPVGASLLPKAPKIVVGMVCVCVWTFSKEVKLVPCHPCTFHCYSLEFFTIHCRMSINSFW